QTFDVELHTAEIFDLDAEGHTVPLFDDYMAVSDGEQTVRRLNREPNGLSSRWGLFLAPALLVHGKGSSPAASALGVAPRMPLTSLGTRSSTCGRSITCLPRFEAAHGDSDGLWAPSVVFF